MLIFRRLVPCDQVHKLVNQMRCTSNCSGKDMSYIQIACTQNSLCFLQPVLQPVHQALYGRKYCGDPADNPNLQLPTY